MRLYMFKSDSINIRAFAGDAEGSRLPEKFGPWAPDGVVEIGQHPPRNLSRSKIEMAIKTVGFQLWREKESIA
jgi:hypothetical protein